MQSTARRLILISLSALLFSISSQSFALGLGKLHIHSKLGEPLNASLEVKLSQDEILDDIRASLASKDVYKTMNINYGYNLSSLQLTLLEKTAEAPERLVISSKNPFNEPYLEVIINVKSPTQQFNRSLTLLLDAPDKASAQSVFKQ